MRSSALSVPPLPLGLVLTLAGEDFASACTPHLEGRPAFAGGFSG